MSRRKRFDVAPHITYGQIEFRCPADHPLGAVLATTLGVIHRLDRPLHDTRPAASTPVDAGQTLIFECDACRNAHQRTHYELGYDALIGLLTAERTDTASDRRTVSLS